MFSRHLKDFGPSIAFESPLAMSIETTCVQSLIYLCPVPLGRLIHEIERLC